jgi:hypothetical protein
VEPGYLSFPKMSSGASSTSASGDLTDLMSIPLYQNPASMYGALRAFVAHLTPHLAGEAIKDYLSDCQVCEPDPA